MSVPLPRRLGVCAAVVLAPASPAQTSPPKPVDARVVGTVVRTDGTPAAGVPMRVTVGDTGVTIFTSRPPKLVTTMTSNGEGGYSSVLPASYVPGRETDDDWVVSASLPAGNGDRVGPTSSFEFEVNTAVQDAPPLPFWEADTAVAVDGLRARVSTTGPLPSDGWGRSVFLGDMVLPGTAATFDLRLLEPEGPAGRRDLAFGAMLAGDVTVAHREGRTIYHQRLVTRQRTVPVELPVPPSRGSPCVLTFASGETLRRTNCVATDGKFSAEAKGPSGAVPASVTVELAAAVDTGTVFVRGCLTQCLVEVSVDGSAWTKAPVSRAEAASVRVALIRDAGPVRFVRVGEPSPSPGIAEISVWPGTPPLLEEPGEGRTTARRPGVVPAPAPAPPAIAEEAGAGWFAGALKALAGMLVVGAGVALALVARSRR